MEVTRFELKSKRGRTRWQEVAKQKKEGGRWRQSTCHVFGQIHCVNRDRGGKNSNLPRLWTDTLCELKKVNTRKEGNQIEKEPWWGIAVEATVTCHVLGQIHCVSVKSLNWLNKKGEMVEKMWCRYSGLSRPWTDTLCEYQISKLVKLKRGGNDRKVWWRYSGLSRPWTDTLCECKKSREKGKQWACYVLGQTPCVKTNY